MKTRKLVWFAMLMCALSGQAADLKTFDELRVQYGTYKDPTRVSYMFNRCAALNLNVAAFLARKGQAKGAGDFESLAQHYMVLSEANEREIDKKRGLKSKDTMKTVHRNVATVSEVYSQRMKRNFLHSGDYLRGDTQMEEELLECMNPDTFVKKISKL